MAADATPPSAPPTETAAKATVESRRVKWDPATNTLNLNGSQNGAEGRTSWSARFSDVPADKGASFAAASEAAAPGKLESFSCSGKFNGQSVSAHVSHRPVLENRPVTDAMIAANPALAGLKGQGSAYALQTFNGPPVYARGDEGVQKLVDQARAQCGLGVTPGLK